MTQAIRICGCCQTPKPETPKNFAYRVAALKVFKSVCRGGIYAPEPKPELMVRRHYEAVV